MADTKSLFSKATQLFKKLVAHRLVPIGILFVVGNSISLNLEDQIAVLSPTQETLKLTLTLCMGLWDLTEGILTILLLSWGLPHVHPLKGPKFLSQPFERAYLGSFLAEYLRVLGNILLWGILLIIPGFVQYVRLIFVPLIVFFSKDYEADTVDALELSRKLSKGCFKLLIVLILAISLIQILLEMTPNMVAELHTLPLRLAFNLTSFLISIWSYSFIVVLFEREMEK
jgi:hypothetical protein